MTVAVLGAFLRRDWKTTRSYRLQFALDVVGTGYALALFFFLGRLVDASDLDLGPGFQRGYFAFALVGVALTRILQTGLMAFSSKLRGEQSTGTLEALLATPAPGGLLIFGGASYDLLGALVSTIGSVVFAAIVFGFRPSLDVASLAVTAAGLAGCLALFTSMGVVLAGATLVFKQTGGLVGMVVAGVSLLGGAYFPVEVLPGPLRAVAEVLPFTWGLDVIRKALLAGVVDGPRLGMLSLAGAISLPVSFAILRSAVQHARKRGTLTHF